MYAIFDQDLFGHCGARCGQLDEGDIQALFDGSRYAISVSDNCHAVLRLAPRSSPAEDSSRQVVIFKCTRARLVCPALSCALVATLSLSLCAARSVMLYRQVDERSHLVTSYDVTQHAPVGEMYSGPPLFK